MTTSIAFPLMLVTYCSSSMPATVWLHGHFDCSLIWPWVKFQSDKLPYPAAKSLFNHLGSMVEEDGMHAWSDKVCKGWFPTRCIPLCKSFCFCSEDKMMIQHTAGSLSVKHWLSRNPMCDTQNLYFLRWEYYIKKTSKNLINFSKYLIW